MLAVDLMSQGTLLEQGLPWLASVFVGSGRAKSTQTELSCHQQCEKQHEMLHEESWLWPRGRRQLPSLLHSKSCDYCPQYRAVQALSCIRSAAVLCRLKHCFCLLSQSETPLHEHQRCKSSADDAF